MKGPVLRGDPCRAPGLSVLHTWASTCMWELKLRTSTQNTVAGNLSVHCGKSALNALPYIL